MKLRYRLIISFCIILFVPIIVAGIVLYGLSLMKDRADEQANGYDFIISSIQMLNQSTASQYQELSRVAEYDRCPSSHTVALPDGTYCYCRLEADRPFGEFLPYAAAEQARVKEAPSLEDGEDGESLFFVSCVPWLSYTALTQPTPTPADSNPRITWGRWHRQEGRTLLPMTLLANHALVDGIHIARFYEGLDREIAALCGGSI